MAFYNFPLRMLKLVRDAEQRGQPFMTANRRSIDLRAKLGIGFAYHPGHIKAGRQADFAIPILTNLMNN